jgi:carbamoylphosphate synthase small subunit
VNGKPVFSVQHHPEASPGPQDSSLPVRSASSALMDEEERDAEQSHA